MPNIQKALMNKGLKEILTIQPIGIFYCSESLCLLILQAYTHSWPVVGCSKIKSNWLFEGEC